MAEYELVREIPNLCRNNQMRDVFVSEVETDDPAAYVRDFVKGEIQYVMKKQNSSDLDRDGIRIVLEVRGANSNRDS